MKQKLWIKILAFVLTIVMAALAVGCAVAAAFMIDQDMYRVSKEAYMETAFENITTGDAQTLLLYALEEDETAIEDYMKNTNLAAFSAKSTEETEFSYKYGRSTGRGYTSIWVAEQDNNGVFTIWQRVEPGKPFSTVEVTVYLADDLPVKDGYWFCDLFLSLLFALRFWVYIIGVLALTLVIVCFVFLLCASGHHKGDTEVRPGWGTKIPVDILAAMTAFLEYFLLHGLWEVAYFHSDMIAILVTALCAIAMLSLFMGFCMSLALRVKLGGWWKNSVCCFVLRTMWRSLRAIGRGTLALARNLPLVWKTGLLLVGITGLELLVLVLCWWETDVLVVWWVLEKLVLIPITLYTAIVLRKLQKGGKALAGGDLSHQVDTKYMVLDFRAHGEDLNRISDGMTRAVEQRMKSERMKTELITNVSHDIKTPLTSIINYADLIGKEKCENETITEYASVLHRQSERLKRLIEDLVEASKAANGSLEVLLSPCEVGVLLSQTAGEYAGRLQERELELVVRQPEAPVKILADGRRLWRVVDNLMNNIIKYGQSGTRVYLSLEEKDGAAVITFRNTSAHPLELSAEELMERFVQGDASRHGDGSGLGLSIAKSLTELQGGTLDLTVDGDLFKVVLRFPKI